MRTVRLLALALSGWVALLATYLPEGSLLRIFITVGFLLTCPGAAVVAVARPILPWHARSSDLVELLVLSIGLSIALGILVSEVFFLAGVFTVRGVLLVLVGITGVAAFWALSRHHRPARRDGRPRSDPAEGA
mgnify:FL=1